MKASVLAYGDYTLSLIHIQMCIRDSLGNVIKGDLVGRENEEEIIVFETVGVATQDLVAARTIYDKAVEAGVGIEWNQRNNNTFVKQTGKSGLFFFVFINC